MKEKCEDCGGTGYSDIVNAIVCGCLLRTQPPQGSCVCYQECGLPFPDEDCVYEEYEPGSEFQE